MCEEDVAALIRGASFSPMTHNILRFLFVDLRHCVISSSMGMQQFVHLRLQGLGVAVLCPLN